MWVGIGGKRTGGGGVLKGQPTGEFVGEVAGEGLVAEIFFAVELLDEFEGVLADDPIAEAALFPFGEVLFGDRAGIELSDEEGFDFGEMIEPGQDRLGLVVVLETAVELIAEVVR